MTNSISDKSMGMGFLEYSRYLYHRGLYAMQKHSYLGKVTLVSIWFRMILIQVIPLEYEDPLTLTYPSNINI